LPFSSAAFLAFRIIYEEAVEKVYRRLKDLGVLYESRTRHPSASFFPSGVQALQAEVGTSGYSHTPHRIQCLVLCGEC